MKEDAIPFYGLSFYFAAVMEMEDVETPATDVVVVTTYGSSFFCSAAVTETVTESAVSNHKPKKGCLVWLPFFFLFIMQDSFLYCFSNHFFQSYFAFLFPFAESEVYILAELSVF